MGMTKAEFMSRYINDMYNKRQKQKYSEADIFLIEAAKRQRVRSDKKKRRGVYKNGNE